MSQTSGDIHIIPPSGGEALNVFGGAMIQKSDGGDFPLFLAEHPIPPGYVVPPHVHERDDEAFYLLEGELTLLKPSGEVRVGPGTCVLLPRGSVHGFRNDTGSVVRFLVLCNPGIQAAEMFRQFDRAGHAASAGLSPAEIVGIAAQYGVHMG